MSEHSVENLIVSTKTYAGDLEGHLDDLVDHLDGDDEGRAIYAREHVRHAISDLKKIDSQEVDR